MPGNTVLVDGAEMFAAENDNLLIGTDLSDGGLDAACLAVSNHGTSSGELRDR